MQNSEVLIRTQHRVHSRDFRKLIRLGPLRFVRLKRDKKKGINLSSDSEPRTEVRLQDGEAGKCSHSNWDEKPINHDVDEREEIDWNLEYSEQGTDLKGGDQTQHN